MVFNSLQLHILTAATSSTDSPFTEDDFTSKIFPNGFWDFLIQLIAFVILLLIVFFLAYKPLKKMLKQRADYVEGQIRDAETNAAVAREAALTKEETIQEGKIEANRIVAEAKSQAEAEAAKIKAAAEEDASARRQRADLEIAQAKAQAEVDAKEQIVDVALAASSHLLGREVDSEDNKRLLDDFISSLNPKEGE